jgi:hypothetical protein
MSCPASGRAPTKAAYEAFDADPSLEFDHLLAERLGWRSVDVMREQMSAGEWMRWWVYYARKAQRAELAMEQTKG